MHLFIFLALYFGFQLEVAMEMSLGREGIDGDKAGKEACSRVVKGLHTKLELEGSLENVRDLIEACFRQECNFFKECSVYKFLL